MVFSLAFANIVGVASLALASTVTTTLTTSTIVITPTQTIPSDAPQFTNPSVFTSSVLNTTNSIRNDFNATDVSWNQTLAKFASSYLASMGSLESTNGSECNWSHSGGPYGENIALGCNSVTGCINLWAQEVHKYNYSDPGFSEETGHFTQLVWEDTTTVGCASRLCGVRGWYLVCEYWPRGNIVGEFPDEVAQQVGGTGSASDDTLPLEAGWNQYDAPRHHKMDVLLQ